MNTITLQAKSSSGDSYDVTFEISDVIVVRCNCKAGIFGKLCKHKTTLLSGDESMLFNLVQKSALDELLELVKQSEYMRIENELLIAKKAVEIAKKHEKKVKKTVERILKEGILLTSEN